MISVNAGDLLFYRADPHSWKDRFVAAATSDGNLAADFVHVAIVEDVSTDGKSGTIIEAQWRGVVRSPLPDLTSPHIVVYPLKVPSAAVQRAALGDAGSKVGWHYGIADIISQGLRLLRLPFMVGRLHSLDCSHLAAEYAAWASQDLALYAMVADAGADISPNDLARYYGLTRTAAYATPH